MRAAIYLRVSTERDEQKLSPEHQLATCIEYAMGIGLETSRELVYNDAGQSGVEMAKRIEVQRLVADARNGKFEVVLFTAISRFARDLSDALQLKKRLESLYGIRIISVEEGYDTAVEGRNSEMVFTVHAMVAAHKSQEMSRAIRRGLRQSAASGRHIGNAAPFGYQKTYDKKLIPDPQTAPVVLEIYCLYVKGMGCKAIAEELNHRGVMPARAAFWQASSVNAILHNPVYKGDLVANKWRTDTDIEMSRRLDAKIRRQQLRRQDDWVVVKGSHQAIIDEDTFAAVQNRLSMKAANKGVRRQANALSGLLRCGECGGAMIVKSGKKDANGKAYKYIGCAAVQRIGKNACQNHTSFRYGDVLDAVLTPLQNLSAAPELADQLVGQLLPAVSERHMNEQILALRRQLGRNEKRQQEALRAYTKGVFHFELVKEHQRELENEANRIRGEVAKLETKLASQDEWTAKKDEFRDQLNVFRHLEKFDAITIRSALAQVVDSIEFTADRRVKILWKWDSETSNNLRH